MKTNGSPGGAFGKNGKNFNDRPRRDIPRVKVSAFYPQTLDFLRGEKSVHVGHESTRLDCYLRTENGTLMARFIYEKELRLPKQPDFKLMAGEEYYPDEQAAQVVVNPWGKTLSPDKVKVLRDDNGQARYPGLRYLTVVKCHGNDLKFRLWDIGFIKGSQRNDSIALRSDEMEIGIPGSLQARFFGQKEPQFSLEDVETAIEQHLAAMVDVAKKNGDQTRLTQALRTQENATPFIRAMAVSYLMAIGANISMQDVPARETTVAEQTNEAIEPETDEVADSGTNEDIETDGTNIAAAQAALQSEQKQDAKRRKPAKKKAAA